MPPTSLQDTPCDQTLGVALRSGRLHAQVAPELGGALATFYSESSTADAPVHWLRPTPARAWASGNPLEFASFVLVPWSNRIENGCFDFDGVRVQLPPSPWGLGPHSLHGLGWVQPWEVVQRSPASVLLRWRYDGQGAWPWALEATQHYALDAQGLAITVSLRNTGTRRMPAGLGHHPYFAHERDGAGTVLRAQVRGMWQTDAQTLPRQLLQDHPALRAMPQGLRLDQHALDTHFPGLAGEIHITWNHGRSLCMRTSEALHTLVLYTPEGAPFFCAEPVSHCANWLHLRHEPRHTPWAVGGHVLAPGDTLSATLRFDPQGAASPNNPTAQTAVV